MLATLKRLWSPLKDVLPAPLLNLVRSIYSRSYRLDRVAQRNRRLADESWPSILQATGANIVDGPFKGARYIHEAAGSELCPKILGSYEKELYPTIEAIIENQPTSLIDIGAAEGFYAVGFALRLPYCRVVAFESDPHARELLLQLASMNGVADRIEIRGHCGLADLASCVAEMGEDCVIICDAEGAEFDLLDPSEIPALARISMLVELHPWVYPHVKSALLNRFHPSGSATIIPSRARPSSDFPPSLVSSLSRAHQVASLNEFRPSGMEWLWIEPKGDPPVA